MKIISFNKQGPRAVCILSAQGVISNATLQQPDSSGGTLTYEGIFDIIGLMGSFTPTEAGARAGTLTVTLVGPDGRLIGGTLAGLLVAGGPVQVVVGSFLPSGHQEHKPKKQKMEPNRGRNALGSAAVFPTGADKECYVAWEQNNSTTPKPTLDSPTIHMENWACMETTSDSRKSTTDINISLHGV
ncbi:hypothetical protein U1Q18_023434 [Sarracenia purpurea var. burkii]